MSSFFYNKKIIIYIIISSILFSFFYTIRVLSEVGKTFQGFSVEFSLTFSPVTSRPEWTGADQNIPEYSKIISVDGFKPKNINEFKEYINKQLPGKELEYIFSYNGKIFKKKIKTMIYSLEDYIDNVFRYFIIFMFYIFISILLIKKTLGNKKNNIFFIANTLMSFGYIDFFSYDLDHKLIFLFYFSWEMSLAFFIYFGAILTNSEKIKKIARYNIIFSFLLSLFISSLAFNIFNDLNAKPLAFNLFFKTYMFLIGHITLSFIIFFILIAYAYKINKVDSIEKKQLRIILTGSIVAFSPYIILWFIPWIFSYNYSFIMYFLMFPLFLFPLFIFYSIIRYKNFDIEFYIRKSIIYIILSTLLFSIYIILTILLSDIFNNFFQIEKDYLICFVIIISFIITVNLKNYIQMLIDRILYREKIDFIVLFNIYIKKIINIQTKNEFIIILSEIINNSLKPKNFAIYEFKDNIEYLLLKSNNTYFENNLKLPSNKYIDSNFFEKKLNYNEDLFFTIKNNEKQSILFILISEKLSENYYSSDEKEFIKLILKVLSITYSNILFLEEKIEVMKKKELLIEKERIINEISVNLSHDLKSPIIYCNNLIDNFIKKLEHKPSKDETTRNLSMIRKSLDRIKSYIHLSLDKEMYELGRLKIGNNLFSLKDTCEEIIFLYSDYAESKNISIRILSPRENIIIKGDKVIMERIISNLIHNGIKNAITFVCIQIKILENNIFISIENDGKSIPKEIKDKIFEKYISVNGSGLGLYISKKYIELINGIINLDEDSRNTKFNIMIPLTI